MGRTNPTYRDTIRGLEAQWQPYRRALRHRDQPHFDRLFDHARAHADASGYLNHRIAELPLFLSILLEQERRLRELEQQVDSAGSPPEDTEGAEYPDGLLELIGPVQIRVRTVYCMDLETGEQFATYTLGGDPHSIVPLGESTIATVGDEILRLGDFPAVQ